LLAKISLTTEDIDCVIVTHLHFDHAGSLKEFKKSRIVVQSDEFRYVFWSDWFFTGIYEQSGFNYPYLNYELIEGNYDLAKDARIISIPGHSPGTQGVFVESDSGRKVILTSDACYALENFGPPKRLPGLLVDAHK
jgi:N-acyl homoserine lactone hydrolase